MASSRDAVDRCRLAAWGIVAVPPISRGESCCGIGAERLPPHSAHNVREGRRSSTERELVGGQENVPGRTPVCLGSLGSPMHERLNSLASFRQSRKHPAIILLCSPTPGIARTVWLLCPPHSSTIYFSSSQLFCSLRLRIAFSPLDPLRESL